MASTSSTNPAYNVLSFNGRDCLVALHKEITDFLHYQSHVWFAATESLLPHTSSANKRERETIIEFLKEECARIRTLKRLLEMADDNTAALHISKPAKTLMWSYGLIQDYEMCRLGLCQLPSLPYL